MKLRSRPLLIFGALAAWCLLLAAAPGAQEQSGLAPEALAQILAEGAASLEKELMPLKAGADTTQQQALQAEENLQKFRAQVATLRASLAVKELPVKQAQEILGNLAARDKALAAENADVTRKRDELAEQEASRAKGFTLLRQELKRLAAARHPVMRSPQVRQAGQRYDQVANQYTAAVARFRELLEKRLKTLEQERQLLTEISGQLKVYVEESWKEELLKRQTPVTLWQQVSDIWQNLRGLPPRSWTTCMICWPPGRSGPSCGARPAPWWVWGSFSWASSG